MMIRNPAFYLNKARYFYGSSKNRNIDSITEDEIDNVDDAVIEEVVEQQPYVKIEPMVLEEVSVDDLATPEIKKQYARYYDPVTKHYYKTKNILGMNRAPSDVWYPENPLGYKTMRDPKTGKYYRVRKIYDNNGNYQYKPDELVYTAQMQNGTNYYRPLHIKNFKK